MARKRASMREGPLAELFRATEASQRQEGSAAPVEESPAPAADAADQQTLIEPPPASSPAPEANPLSRREVAALEETVEHVHDFVEGADPPDERRSEAPEAVAPPTKPTPGPAAKKARATPAPVTKPDPPYEPPASRFIGSMPEGAPRLNVGGEAASYLAVIRVVGVGGGGRRASRARDGRGPRPPDSQAMGSGPSRLRARGRGLARRAGTAVRVGSS